MKIALISDLHLEAEAKAFYEAEYDGIEYPWDQQSDDQKNWYRIYASQLIPILRKMGWTKNEP